MIARDLVIAIDYDGTYTADRVLWDAFIQHAQLRGHTVKCVTMRRNNEEETVKHKPNCEVIYTARKAKKAFCLADIWIDDQPELVSNHHWTVQLDAEG